MTAVQNEEQPTTIIESNNGFNLQLKELWEYRELVFFLGWKDVLSRYSQLYVGITWAFIQPVFSVVVLTIVMGRLAKLPSDGVPYPLFAFAGTLCWQYISTVSMSAHSIGGASGKLMSKVYFPRLVFPLSLLIPPAVDFISGLSIFMLLMLVMGYSISSNIIWLPLFMLLGLITAFTFALWFMALSISFRDLKQVIPLIIQLLYMTSGVFYSNKLVPEKFQLLYDMNPVASIIQGFRWVVFGTGHPPGWHLGLCIAILFVAMVSGMLVYNRIAKSIADII
ncbi:MAG: ABC transporter permease [Candidatus Obscuribacterales bacterium]|nr:ABC transporter permease [Candidatus Obscuribacterales bacterium]